MSVCGPISADSLDIIDVWNRAEPDTAAYDFMGFAPAVPGLTLLRLGKRHERRPPLSVRQRTYCSGPVQRPFIWRAPSCLCCPATQAERCPTLSAADLNCPAPWRAARLGT